MAAPAGVVFPRSPIGVRYGETVALSLHAEYLLGYLAGAKNLAVREVVPLALAGAGESPQTRALLKALALGMSDGRRGRTLREPHEVRIHVLALLTRENGPRLSRRSMASEAPPPLDDGPPESDPSSQIEDFILEAAELG